jgi:GT2 family glycosyltransferase
MNRSIKYFFYNDRKQNPLPQNATGFANWQSAVDAVTKCEAEYCLLADAALASSLSYTFLESDTWSGDVLHAGFRFNSQELLQPLQITALSWFFLNLPDDQRSISWKASSHLVVIKKSAWTRLQGFSPQYTSSDVSVMDFVYRVMRSGGAVFYEPSLIAVLPAKKMAGVWSDHYNDFLFTRKTIHRKAAITILAYKLIHSVLWWKIIQAYRKAMKVTLQTQLFFPGDPCWKLITQNQKKIEKYSAIIPTLDRYDYLPAAIESLLNQSRPPEEIIVYDQTDVANRDPSVFEKFDPKKVIVVYGDVKGQCTARNGALSHTKHEWCFLFDDDSVAMPTMVEAHINFLEQSEYFVSTGASLSPGQEFKDLPYTINFYHQADVLDTGNCFIHKKILREVNFFDKAFDRGPGADNDLGTRIYLKGIGIVFNPESIRIHYKATTGGLRTFGVWWRFKTTLMGAYPPPSQTYTVQKYYPQRFWKYLYLRFFFKAAYRQNLGQMILLWLFAPLKLYASIREARKLKLLQHIKP